MSEISPPPGAFFIAGPTGSGKSSVALCMAEMTGAAILCGDAFQVYGGMAILTAQPSTHDMEQAPHHLYGRISPEEEFDVARFERIARREIEEVRAGGRLALVTGGSGLYLKSLTHGLAPVPPSDPGLRAELEKLPADELAARLAKVDPVSAAALNLKNARHVLRALEISLLAGRPASALRETFRKDPGVCGVQLVRDRPELRSRIRERCERMFASGVIDEVKALLQRPLSATSAKAIGLAEVIAVIEGRLTAAAAIEAITTASAQYAKRQETWLRRETCLQPVHLAPAEQPDLTAQRILRCFPLQGPPAHD